MSQEIQRALGRIEGNQQAMQNTLGRIEGKQDSIDGRVGAIERKTAVQSSVISGAVAAGVSAVATLLKTNTGG